VAATREFLVMVKPTGSLCNLACRYCYYLRTRQLFPPDEPPRMSDTILEEYIVQHVEASPSPVIHFEWHGGEPTVLGLDFYRKVVALQRRHRPPGRWITNGLQTNGTLLDEAWARFLAAEGFWVGVSLDGPEAVHDRYRLTAGGKPTHAAVMRAWRLLSRHRVRTDVLCVLHDQNARSPLAVYRFFKEIGVRHLQFLPLVERLPGGGVSPRTVPAEAFGAFLCAVFDEWVRHDIGQVVVQGFDEAFRVLCGVGHALCVFRETCGDVPVVEHTGDVFACDHFVDPAHRLGNIRTTRLEALVESEALRAFGRAKRDTLPEACRRCDVLPFCHGGCPKDRAAEGVSYLCAGYQRFFRHARPNLQELAALWRAGQPLERLGERLRAEARAPPRGRAQRAVPVRQRPEVQALLSRAPPLRIGRGARSAVNEAA
jgi:uncharacterized protein